MRHGGVTRARGEARLRVRLRAAGLAVAVLGGLGGGILVLPGAPAYAVDIDCADVTDAEATAEADAASLPLAEMDIADAQAAVPLLRPGATGVAVAVLDSGVFTGNPTRLPVAQEYVAAGQPVLVDYHGSAVAGLIAGGARADGTPIGISPGSPIVSVKVYDQQVADPEEGLIGVTPEGVLAGLTWVQQNAAALGIGIVNISLAIPDAPGMQDVIDRLWRAGVIVVAPSGNRPSEPGDPLYESFPTFAPDEDAQGVVHPAAYDHVVAVSTTVQGAGQVSGGGDDGIEPYSFVLQNSDTDVAAPSAGAVSVSRYGGTCVLSVPATSWATAEVSGVLALLRSAYPDERPAQLVARLTSTADGREDQPTLYTGAGVVQPYDALTRPLAPDAQGRLGGNTLPVEPDVRASAPEPRADLLRSTRRDAVWWGLVGGGALVLALVLRPVLARRRR